MMTRRQVNAGEPAATVMTTLPRAGLAQPQATVRLPPPRTEGGAVDTLDLARVLNPPEQQFVTFTQTAGYPRA